MNRPMPAAPIIKKHAMELLNKNGRFTIPELKEYVHQQTNENYTPGQFSGALESFGARPDVIIPTRGVYALAQRPAPPVPKSIRSKVKNVLDSALSELEQLGRVDILDIDEGIIEDAAYLRKVISSIKSLRNSS